ncbi:MAG: hypothetical protein KUG81_08200 [Gammaproteobacteria bacterium]|nr:hypothetical protein [Gammaproteobacteria bacterium]
MSKKDVQKAFENAETIAPLEGQDGPPDSDYPDHDAHFNGQETQNGDGDGQFPPGADDDCAEARCAGLPLNDYGNGQRLAEYYGHNILYVPRLGWYRWGERRWLPDEDELKVRRDAQKIAGRILGEIPFIVLEPWQLDALNLYLATQGELTKLERVKDRTEEQAERLAILREIQTKGQGVQELLQKAKAEHRKHSRSTGNTPKISNMLLEARVAAATTVGALNADPLMLNCETGVVHFVQEADAHDGAWGDGAPVWQAKLLPHDRGQMISKMAEAGFDPEVKFDGRKQCPVFMDFLEDIQREKDVRDFLQRWFGYSLTGLTREQKLAFFFGGGRNGKSTLVDVVARILADYGTTLPIETLTGSEQRKGSDATPDLVRLPGARFVRASEPEQGKKFKEALVKALTGGEAIMIRRMMQEFVEIDPEFKLTISGNHKPEIRGADDGIWRRVLLVPFNEQVKEENIDPDLAEKLWAERDGILAWMIAGCLDYLENGLGVPETVRKATDEYRNASDPMRVFLTTECTITGAADDFETGRDLGDAFNTWLISIGDTPWGKRTTSNRIKERAGVVKGESGFTFEAHKISDTGYRGIVLSDAARDRIAIHGEELRAGGGGRK